MNDLEFHPSDDNSENESSSECSDEEEEDIEDSVDFGEQSFVESSDDDREDFDNNGEKNVSEDQSEELVIVAPDSEQPTAVKGLENTKDTKTINISVQ